MLGGFVYKGGGARGGRALHARGMSVCAFPAHQRPPPTHTRVPTHCAHPPCGSRGPRSCSRQRACSPGTHSRCGRATGPGRVEWVGGGGGKVDTLSMWARDRAWCGWSGVERVCKLRVQGTKGCTGREGGGAGARPKQASTHEAIPPPPHTPTTPPPPFHPPHQHVQQALVPGVELAQPARVLAQARRQGVQQARSAVAQRAGEEGGVAQVVRVCVWLCVCEWGGGGG